jgi:hypothetical protein
LRVLYQFFILAGCRDSRLHTYMLLTDQYEKIFDVIAYLVASYVRLAQTVAPTEFLKLIEHPQVIKLESEQLE